MSEDSVSNGPDVETRASNTLSNSKRPRPKNDSQSRPRKLARQACTACRAKKIRCDAMLPKCAYCIVHDCECIFPPIYKRALCSQSHVDALQEKIKEYEAILTKERLITCSKDGNGVTLAQQPTRALEENHYHPSKQTLTVEESLPSICGEEDDETVGNEDDSIITDGMVQYTATSPQGLDDDGFFTESSNLNFAMYLTTTVQGRRLCHVRDGVSRGSGGSLQKAKLLGSPSRPKVSGYDMANFSGHDDNGDYFKQTLASPELQSLPLRHMAEDLLDRYFRIINIVWPFLLEDVTRDRFNRMWMSSQPQNPVWMAQLNLIMSLACQFYDEESVGNESLPKIYDAGKQFYRRARCFIIPSMFTGNSIGMLQNLLLMVQYQQGTMRANQCWLTIGYAIRMAQGLGLHLLISEDTSLPIIDVELRKRLWWGCFCLDRVSSMIYGRPLGISERTSCNFDGELPKPIDDKYLAQDQPQPKDVPSINAFLGCNVELYAIMDSILEKLSQTSNVQKCQDMNTNGSSSSPQGIASIENNALHLLTTIVQLDKLLLNWHANLPTYLKFLLDKVTCDNTLSPQIQRQRNILRSRFLGMRVLLHRQTILVLLQNSDKRIWHHGTTTSWLALFSNVTYAAEASDTPPAEAGGQQPSLEAVIARHSARICVSSALLQIESIDTLRPIRRTGAWWWNFHFLFNSLCVLIGAMAMKPEDMAVVVPDLQMAEVMVQRGLRNIHELGERGGDSIWHSERFLRRLMRTTRHHIEVCWPMHERILPLQFFRLLTVLWPRKNHHGQLQTDVPSGSTPDLWETLATMAGPIPAPNDDLNTSYLNYFSLASNGPGTTNTPNGGGLEKHSSELGMEGIFPFDVAGDNDPSGFSSGTSDLNALERLFYTSSGEWHTFDGPQSSTLM
ncbi:hypothetical protein B7463_g10395, partial [Scytalidium lignicola]